MRIEAVELDDYYDADDGRRVVLIEQRVAVISPVAAALLDVVAEGEMTLDALTVHLVEIFGEPPAPMDARTLTEQAARELQVSGLVTCISGA